MKENRLGLIEMTLSENMKSCRKNAGITQRELARRSGLSFSMVSKLESGEQSNPSFETLKKIADILGVSPAELVDESRSIEEQIEEYLQYKRGLSQKQNTDNGLLENQTIIHKRHQRNEEHPMDINFRKKIQAINPMLVPNEPLEGMRPVDLHRRPEIRKLLSSLQTASKEDVEKVITFVEAFRKINL